jgi:hypothetical protein
LLCEKRLSDETGSREHIIPNSIGGRKKVSGFLCVTCNSTSGQSWESALAEQMKPLSLFFRVKRDRGDTPSQAFQTANGREWVLKSDGSLNLPRPVFNETKTYKGVEINISARDMAEAKKMLKGVARKYPQLDINELLEKAKTVSTYPQDQIRLNLSFGGLDAGRSFVKTALALLSTTSASPSECEHAVQFLKEEQAEPCFGYYYEKDLVVGRPTGVPVHCVHVNGDPDSQLVRGYLEYFGVMRVVMCLSSSYSGDEFSATYSVNPVTGEELDLAVDLDLTSSEITKAYDYEMWDGNAVRQAMGAVIGPTLENQHEEEKERVLNEAVQYAFDNCGAIEGEELTEEQRKRWVSLLWEKMEPWIVHQIAGRQRGS